MRQLGYGEYGALKIITLNYTWLGASFSEQDDVCKTVSAKKKDATFEDGYSFLPSLGPPSLILASNDSAAKRPNG
jgi:hypothetical protein